MALFEGYSVGKLKISNGLVLAPMSGVTSSSFRRLIKELNPGCVGLVVSEFISVEALTRNVKRSLDMMRFTSIERPVGIQIFGYDVERMTLAAKMAADTGVDLIDINCGCPAPKVVKKGGGCELMRQPEHLLQILKALRKAVTLPLTLKMRSGWEESAKNAVQIAKMCESEGLDGLAVHGRTRAQMYRGLADWQVVREVADSVKIPVLGSGDVTDQASYKARVVDGPVAALIGRAAIYNPYVFSEIFSGKSFGLRGNSELQLKAIARYMELLEDECTPVQRVGRIKQLVSQMCRGSSWRLPFLTANTFAEQLIALKNGQDLESRFDTNYTRI